jgi:hypothetical protein
VAVHPSLTNKTNYNKENLKSYLRNTIRIATTIVRWHTCTLSAKTKKFFGNVAAGSPPPSTQMRSVRVLVPRLNMAKLNREEITRLENEVKNEETKDGKGGLQALQVQFSNLLYVLLTYFK